MTLLKYKRALLSTVVSFMIIVPQQAGAASLKDALAQAYSNNATLNARRAAVRAQEEDISLARAGFMPQLNAVGDLSNGWVDKGTLHSRTGTLQIQVAQNLFNGFQTYNGVAGAKAQVKSAQENLRNEEQTQLINAVDAYTEVYASRNIAKLRKQNLVALEEQVRASRVRLNVGAGTRTDLAQAEAARARALADLSQAEAEVHSAEATYRQIIGVEPGDLVEPSLADGLPQTLEQAYAIAQKEHPAILAGKYSMDASAYNVNAKMGALLPKLDVTAGASYNKSYESALPFKQDGWSQSVGVRVSMPLFTGGANAANIRRAKEQLASARISEDISEDSVRRGLESSWAQLQGLRSALIGSRDSVRAAKIALEGRVHENRVGQATMLDVLNSRSQLIDVQVSLEKIKRSLVVASYNVRAAMGRMTASTLGLKVEPYDSQANLAAAEAGLPTIQKVDGR